MTGREAKDALYAQFSRLGKALANPKRIELLELLGQAARSVEELAAVSGMDFANVSAQLQVLARANLVEGRRDGRRVVYRISDDSVSRFLASLRELSRERLAEVGRVARDYFEARDQLEPLTSDELLRRLEDSATLILDVRPRQEYAAGHIPGALSVPLGELSARIAELPQGPEIVAYCRGPYCVLAPQAIDILGRAGRRVRRLEAGFPEWRLAGLPVEVVG
jgi:rhodanese-related sulfurtransferase/DNA-binding transcriptional ArsR family regulator